MKVLNDDKGDSMKRLLLSTLALILSTAGVVSLQPSPAAATVGSGYGVGWTNRTSCETFGGSVIQDPFTGGLTCVGGLLDRFKVHAEFVIGVDLEKCIRDGGRPFLQNGAWYCVGGLWDGFDILDSRTGVRVTSLQNIFYLPEQSGLTCGQKIIPDATEAAWITFCFDPTSGAKYLCMSTTTEWGPWYCELVDGPPSHNFSTIRERNTYGTYPYYGLNTYFAAKCYFDLPRDPKTHNVVCIRPPFGDVPSPVYMCALGADQYSYDCTSPELEWGTSSGSVSVSTNMTQVGDRIQAKGEYMEWAGETFVFRISQPGVRCNEGLQINTTPVLAKDPNAPFAASPASPPATTGDPTMADTTDPTYTAEHHEALGSVPWTYIKIPLSSSPGTYQGCWVERYNKFLHSPEINITVF